MINVRFTWGYTGYTLKPMVSHDRRAGPLVESPERHPRFPEPPPRVKQLVMCRLPWNLPKMLVSFVSCSLSADLLDPIFLDFHVQVQICDIVHLPFSWSFQAVPKLGLNRNVDIWHPGFQPGLPCLWGCKNQPTKYRQIWVWPGIQNPKIPVCHHVPHF